MYLCHSLHMVRHTPRVRFTRLCSVYFWQRINQIGRETIQAIPPRSSVCYKMVLIWKSKAKFSTLHILLHIHIPAGNTSQNVPNSLSYLPWKKGVLQHLYRVLHSECSKRHRCLGTDYCSGPSYCPQILLSVPSINHNVRFNIYDWENDTQIVQIVWEKHK